MPNIKTYEAGAGDLHPSEMASAAYVRSGNVEREYTDQTARLMRETGSLIEQSFKEVGGAVTKYTDKAQAYTDSQATLEANKDSAALDLAYNDKIGEMGKPTKDQTTGETSFPSLADTTTQASQHLKDYQEAQNHIREKMVAAGASQKALAAHDERALEHQTMIAHKTAAEVHTLAGVEATANAEKLVNSAASYASSNPGDLDTILGGLEKDWASTFGASGVLGSEAQKAMAGELDKAKRNVITQAAEGMARAGGDLNDSSTGLGQANKLIHDPKYAPYIGTNTDAMQRRLLTVQREEAQERRLQQQEQDRGEKKEADARFAKATTDGEVFDPRKDPYYQKNPEWGHTVEGMVQANREFDLHINQPDPVKSDQARDQLFNQLVVSGRAGVDPDAAQHRVDVAYGVEHSITKAQHQELSQQIAGASRPDNKQFNDDTRAFMSDYKATITGNLDPMKLSIAGGQAEYKVRKLIQTEAEKVRQGLNPDTKDPRDLLDPDSPAFIGNTQKFKDLLVTRDQVRQQRTEARERGAPGSSASSPVQFPQGQDFGKWATTQKPGTYFMYQGKLRQIPPSAAPPAQQQPAKPGAPVVGGQPLMQTLPGQ